MVHSVITSVASSVISSTINSFTTLAWNEINSLGDVPEKVRLIKAKLRLIQSYLKDAENKHHKNYMTTTWLSQLKHVAYQAQDVIEKIIWMQRRRNRARGCTGAFSRYSNIPEYLKNLHDIAAEIERINNFIPGIVDIANNLNAVNIGEGSSSNMADQIEDPWFNDPRKKLHIREEDEVVGFDTEIIEMVNELLDRENKNKQLSVVSISGMGGIGKSTLARKVSNHAEVKTHFDLNLWISISKQYDVLSLQKQILKAASRVEIKNEDLEKMTPQKVREKLVDSLKERKYLIVIDDVWTTQSWDDINPHNSIFPNLDNGSRIILTTRNLDVANYPEMRRFVHEIKLLDAEKSWELLKKKAFPTYVMEMVSDIERNRLERLGSQLVKKCNGLPLALVVLGGYLSKHLDYQTWSRMAIAVDWNEAGNQINISNILALSYHDLPNYLKPAFLYITAFPEDQIIKSSDLIKLWIAEGFVSPGQKYKLEQTARIYLDQLYERGLVQVVRKCITHGRISKIRIHDVLRDWGIDRARDEGFFCIIKDSDDVNPCVAHDPYRVALHGYRDEDIAISMPNSRTIIGFELPPNDSSLRGLNSLRVIHFEHKVRSPTKLKNVKQLIFLRYLRVQDGEINFPSSIGQLSNLQTLYCQGLIRSVPSSLWEISTLRHVHLRWISCKWNGPKKGQGKNLQSLIIYDDIREESPIYTGMVELVVAVEEMDQILRLCLAKVPNNILSNISGLQYLEVLELSEVKGLTRIPTTNVFPRNLLKLELDCQSLVEDPMPVLEKLPKLTVLMLLRGQKLKDMHCSANGFPQLKYLFFSFFFGVLKYWEVDVGAMPNLCHLRLQVIELNEFPEELMKHDQLKLLEIIGTNLHEVDYSQLEEKGCKVILAYDFRDTRLSDFKVRY